MSDPRRRLQRATAILPLALLSAAVTASLASLRPPQAALAAVDGQQSLPEAGTLPDGSTLPEQAIEAPASLSSPSRSGGLGLGGLEAAVQNASTNDLPSAALAAYQRAATVVNAANGSCSIPWQLIAAVGRVESDHGRDGGNVRDDPIQTPGRQVPYRGPRDVIPRDAQPHHGTDDVRGPAGAGRGKNPSQRAPRLAQTGSCLIMMRLHPPAEASLSVFVESPRIPIIDQGPPAHLDRVKSRAGRTDHPPLPRHT